MVKIQLDKFDSEVILESLVTQLAVVQGKMDKLKSEGKPPGIWLIQRQRTLIRLIQVLGVEFGIGFEGDPSIED